jgi:hypothetical protein
MRTPLNVVDNVVSTPSYEGNAQRKNEKRTPPAMDTMHSFTLDEGDRHFLYTLCQYTITYSYVFLALPLLGSNFFFSHHVRSQIT